MVREKEDYVEARKHFKNDGNVFLKSLDDKQLAKTLIKQKNTIKHLFKPLGKPREGDWLDQHNESGQKFQKYIKSFPVLPRGKRRTIYIQPIGSFSKKEREIIILTSEFIGIFFNLPIKIVEDLPLSIIPNRARRMSSDTFERQLNTRYIIYDILCPRLPEDAAAFVAFTTQDLWPERGWNYVFGEASTENRVGVWSINRYGDPNGTQDEFQKCLLRTMKTGTHETAHIFSVEHCIDYNCTMNGSNSLEETDRSPLACCPECMIKICYASKTDPISRYKKMKDFCQKHGFIEEKQFFHNLIELLQK